MTSRTGVGTPTMAPPRPETAAGADIAARLHDIRRRIAAAALRSGRHPEDVLLVAVSKTVDAQRVQFAYDSGQIDFGENRAQELRAKRPLVAAPIRWHFIGRLQRNKVRDVVGVALIHSVDSLALAEAIARRAQQACSVQPILLQVNTGHDPAKAGCAPQDAVGLVERIAELDGIRCEGLMAIPPMDADPRSTFRRLAHLRQQLPDEVRHLSMGMSRDYEVAIEEGATIVRLGEAVFGRRPPPQEGLAAPTEKE